MIEMKDWPFVQICLLFPSHCEVKPINVLSFNATAFDLLHTYFQVFRFTFFFKES